MVCANIGMASDDFMAATGIEIAFSVDLFFFFLQTFVHECLGLFRDV